MTNELTAFIEARNWESRIWVCEGAMVGSDRWAGEMVTDAAHWARMGIYTVEDYLASMDREFEKEMRKAAYMDDYDFSDPEFEAILRAEAEEARVAKAEEAEERRWAILDALQDGVAFRAPRTFRVAA